MLAGATLADPARIDIRGDVEVGRDVFIDINVGPDRHRCNWARASRSGPTASSANSRIGAGTEIFANSIVDHARSSARIAASVRSRGSGPTPFCIATCTSAISSK